MIKGARTNYVACETASGGTKLDIRLATSLSSWTPTPAFLLPIEYHHHDRSISAERVQVSQTLKRMKTAKNPDPRLISMNNPDTK